MASKSAIKRHVDELNLRPEFIQRRDKLKADGVPIEEAWQKAYADIVEIAEQIGGDGSANSTDTVKSTKLSPAMIPAAFRKNKPVPARKVAEWVFENMAVSGLTPADAPSDGAWGLYLWVQASPINQTEFLRSIWKALLPTKSQMEAEDRFSDDGSELIDLAGRLLAAKERAEVPVLSPGPEGLSGESAVPTGASEDWVGEQDLGEEDLASV